MVSKYSDYTLEELLEDGYFLESVSAPTADSCAYWDTLLSHGTVDIDLFEQAVMLLHAISSAHNSMVVADGRLDALWSRIESTNRRSRINRNRLLYLRIGSIAAVAASVAIYVAFTFMGKPDDALQINGFDLSKIAKTVASNEIQLVLPEKQMALQGDNASIDYSCGDMVINGHRHAQATIDEKAKSAVQGSNEQIFNQLIVPFGKRSSLILSDGSEIWVNAGSRVVYPVGFGQKQREIYVDGEIYANIVSNAKWPFVIKTSKMNVEVLGTSLNVMAYENEDFRSVVLVNGRVEVDTRGGQREVIQPNQMYYSSEDKHTIREVDVNLYVSWKDGYYRFKNERLDMILARLSKYCGVKIKCPKESSKLTCSGTLLLSDNIDKLLHGICQTIPMQYRLEADTYVFYEEPN